MIPTRSGPRRFCLSGTGSPRLRRSGQHRGGAARGKPAPGFPLPSAVLPSRQTPGGNAMPDHAGPSVTASTNATVALRLAEAFRRHGVTLTFGQSLPSAFHLASPHVGIDQKVYRQENAGGTMAD